MNTEGIELAASFIVVLVISIVVFGLASAITYKIFCASGDKIDQLDQNTERRVEQLLASGAKVTVPDAAKTAKSSASFCSAGGTSGALFALGVRNDDLSVETYYVDCYYEGRELPDGSLDTSQADWCASSGWDVQHTSEFADMQPKEKRVGSVVINTPSTVPDGKHLFTISVTTSSPLSADPSLPIYGAAQLYYTIQ